MIRATRTMMREWPCCRDCRRRRRGTSPPANVAQTPGRARRFGGGDDRLVCDFRQTNDRERPAAGTKRRISTAGAASKLGERAAAAYLTARAEEKDLIAGFGQRYIDRSAETARLVPFVF